MADYTTLAKAKAFFLADRDADAADDTVITNLITQYSRAIDDHCRRTFYATTETRYYDAIGNHIRGNKLYLDKDLLSITTLTNGDGNTLTENTDFILRPSDGPPFDYVQLLSASAAVWTYSTNWEEAISIAGDWGYSDTDSHPAPVEQALLLLVQHAYLRRENPAGNQNMITASGATIMSTKWPADVKDLLEPYIRRRFGGS